MVSCSLQSMSATTTDSFIYWVSKNNKDTNNGANHVTFGFQTETLMTHSYYYQQDRFSDTFTNWTISTAEGLIKRKSR